MIWSNTEKQKIKSEIVISQLKDEASNVKTRAVPRGYQAPVKVSSYKRIAKREEIYGR